MTDDRSLAAVTALDWIAVVLTGAVALNLLAFPLWISPSYGGMFQDFGSELPGLTRVVLQAWFPLVGLLLVAGVQAAGLLGSMRLGKRRFLIVGAFVLGLAWTGLCWWGLYMPIFELSSFVEA